MGPAYALTVAKGGLKLPKSTCTEPAFGPDAPPLPAGARPCPPMEGAVRKGNILAVDRYAKLLAPKLNIFSDPRLVAAVSEDVMRAHMLYGPIGDN